MKKRGSKKNNARLTKLWKKTKKGLTASMYTSQRSASKSRNMEMPLYTLDEFREWIYNKEEFHTIYDSWVESDYAKSERPSCDRLNDYKPYSFDNIRVVRFKDNEAKPKMSMGRRVIQLTADGNYVDIFNNATEAAVYLTGNPKVSSNILAVCRNKRNFAMKSKWEFEEDFYDRTNL